MADCDFLPAEEHLAAIEAAAYHILEDIGVALTYAPALERLAGAGCRVRRGRVYIPPEVIQWTVEHVGREWTYRAPDGAPAFALRARQRFHNTGGIPFILDSDSDQRRPAMLEDVIRGAKLLDALDNVDFMLPMFGPQDVPQAIMSIAAFEAMLRYAHKPVYSPGIEKPAEVAYIVQLAAARCGGPAAFRRQPTISMGVSPISPLTLSDAGAASIIAIADAGVPLQAAPAPTLGGTGPVTLAGALAMQHAEALACIVLAVVTRPGVPALYVPRFGTLNMRTASCDWGAPEVGMAGAYAAPLAHALGLACDSYGFCSSDDRLDARCGAQRLANAMMPVLAGAEIISGVGGLQSGMVGSLEMAVLDAESISSLRRITAGCDVNADTLAVEVIRETVQEGGSFLAHPHTARGMRNGALWTPGVASGVSDSLDATSQAHATVKRLTAANDQSDLPDAMLRQLQEIVQDAARALARP
jgi:trimethylamine--corrinoid protein Co-methyltransferase